MQCGLCYPTGGEFPRLSSFRQLVDEIHQRRDEVYQGRKQDDEFGVSVLLAVFLWPSGRLPHCLVLHSVVLCSGVSLDYGYIIPYFS